jgi:hypothetical protein
MSRCDVVAVQEGSLGTAHGVSTCSRLICGIGIWIGLSVRAFGLAGPMSVSPSLSALRMGNEQSPSVYRAKRTQRYVLTSLAPMRGAGSSARFRRVYVTAATDVPPTG